MKRKRKRIFRGLLKRTDEQIAKIHKRDNMNWLKNSSGSSSTVHFPWVLYEQARLFRECVPLEESGMMDYLIDLLDTGET